MDAIGWVDADTFYCNAERVRFPTLRGRPLGVLGNNGACVIARSSEMKRAGIAVGDPVWEAKLRCPGGVFLKRDFRWIGDVSARMLEEIRSLAPLAEYFSIDEMGFEALPTAGSYLKTAEAVRGHIRRHVGVPTTAGIARTRTLAKLLCDVAKPFGAAAVLSRAEEEDLLARLPVSELCGIGNRRAAVLAAVGIGTCLEFARADRRLIRRLLTVVGEAIWYEVNGEPVLPLKAERPAHKLLSRGGSLGRETADPYAIHGWLVRNLERLVEEFRFHRLRAGRIRLLVCYRKGRDRHGIARGARASVVPPSDRFDVLYDDFAACLRASYLPGEAATRMHLFAEQLAPEGRRQLALFDEPTADEVADHLKEAINARHGRFALRSAATLALPEVYADPATSKEVCDIRGKHVF